MTNKGQFKKGNGGRKKGSKNNIQIVIDTRKLLKSLLDRNIESIQADLESMKPYERVSALLRLSDIVLPKLQRITLEAETGENMTLKEFIELPIDDRLDHLNKMKGKISKE